MKRRVVRVSWTVMFSRSGKEIADLMNQWKDYIVVPSKIITTKKKDNWHNDLVKYQEMFNIPTYTIDKKYAKDCAVLQQILNDESTNLITLHGWLFIIPEYICNKYDIYNGHPGDIVDRPELKGHDPQEKAFNNNIYDTGSVVHKVVPEVDAGTIHARVKCEEGVLDQESTLEDFYNVLRQTSIKAWKSFLTDESTTPKEVTDTRYHPYYLKEVNIT